MTDRELMLKQNPLVNISRSTAARMWLVAICAFLAALQSAVGDSFLSLIIALAALVSALLTELLITYKTHGFGKIKDGSAAASALTLALLFPNQLHPVYAALSAVFAIAVVKHSFGGLGANWMNPALGGWLFARFSWPLSFSMALNGSMNSIDESGSVIGNMVNNSLNKTFFSFLGAELPPGYMDLFALKTPGIIADRAVLALVLATAVIAASQISRSWLSFVYIAVFGLLTRIFGDVSGSLWNGDVIYAFLSGGTLVAAFILIADPSTGAKSMPGGIIAAILAAVLGFVFRFYGHEFFGCIYAAALVNTLIPLLYKAERRLFYSIKETE
ncbi:MAG: RnfABCDGE type electron transport complex subunit D [Treponema sp.]|jgi:electron transport complex protein RnfD|nr:RnfABCDGE type electron transport complex subunit D [Treponema sp.]